MIVREVSVNLEDWLVWQDTREIDMIIKEDKKWDFMVRNIFKRDLESG